MLVWEFLADSAARTPDKTAIIGNARRFSFADLDQESTRIASILVERGIEPGDRVAVLLENSIDAAASIFGILKAGAVFLVVSQTIKKDKLAYILNDCAVRAIITQPIFLDVVAETRPDVPSLQAVLCTGDPSILDTDSTADLWLEKATSSSSFIPQKDAPDADVAALIYTSGSTGFPKGVTVSHLNIVSAATSITQYLENTDDDVIINALPLSFDYGLYQLLMSVKTGATLVLEKSFVYPFKIVQRIHDEGVTGFPGVPTMFAVLLRMRGLDPSLFDSVRYLTNTAAALPPSQIERLKKLFRNARIFSMYGLTECKRVSYLPPEELQRRPMSVGKGMPNQRVDVIDASGKSVRPGEVGELVVCGSNVMLGYWNQPEDTAEMIRPGRYPWERVLHTGDLFTRDEEGFLYFVARKDDIIKSRGEKVSPLEVERVINELDGISESVVAGLSDPILGQAIVAFVVRVQDSDLTEKAILLHCARRLESYMVPKRVEFRERLPLTSSGKVSRRALEEELRQNPPGTG